MAGKKQTVTEQMIRERLAAGIPEEGCLKHPLQSKGGGERSKAGPELPAGRQVSLRDMLHKKKASEGLPADVNIWTTKHLVSYFAKKYQEETGGNYKITFQSDLPVIKAIGDFLVSNGMARNEWTKNALDWSFKRREEIIERTGYFTLNSILNSINYFYQDVILPQVEEGKVERDVCDTSLIEEIAAAEVDGKAPEIFARFGIPVAASYYVRVKGYDEAKVVEATNALMDRLSKGGTVDKQILGRLLTASVIGSPYPTDFVLLDWRQRYKAQIIPFRKETWWRDGDYKGKPLPKYMMIAKGAS